MTTEAQVKEYIAEYITMIKALKAKGQEMFDIDYNEVELSDDTINRLDEIENMNLHLECCLDLLA